MKIRKSLTAVAALALVGMSLAACSSTEEAKPAASAATKTSDAAMTTSAAASSDAAAKDLVGPACAGYASANPSGAASIDGMAAAPVAQAASANPLLKTLVAAVSGQLNSEVNLVDTLNGGQFTVFAPVDDAFAKLDAATVDTLKTPAGTDTLKKVLTYHVVPNQIAPSAIDGEQTTVEGSKLTVAGSGDNITVTDGKGGVAKVLCGGVHTANATVYLIDSVLMPAS